MPLVETLTELAKPWATYYSDSKAAQAVVMFAHLGGMLWGGGLAVWADRAVWKARKATGDARAALLAEIDAIHAPVVIGLAVSAISGALLTASDVKTFAESPFWFAKVAAFALLLINGRWLQVQERRMRTKPETTAGGWSLLSVASALSITFWFAVTLCGVLLMTMA